jgi:hypothetical protein
MTAVILSVVFRPSSGTRDQMIVFGLQVLTVALLVSSGIVFDQTMVLLSGVVVFVTRSCLQFSVVYNIQTFLRFYAL